MMRVEQRLVEPEELHLDAERLGAGRAHRRPGGSSCWTASSARSARPRRHARERGDLVERADEEAVVVERADDGSRGTRDVLGDVEQRELLEQVVVEATGRRRRTPRCWRSRRSDRAAPSAPSSRGPRTSRATRPTSARPPRTLLGRLLAFDGLGLDLVDLEDGVLEHLDLDELLEVGDGHRKDVEPLIDLGRQRDLLPQFRTLLRVPCRALLSARRCRDGAKGPPPTAKSIPPAVGQAFPVRPLRPVGRLAGVGAQPAGGERSSQRGRQFRRRALRKLHDDDRRDDQERRRAAECRSATRRSSKIRADARDDRLDGRGDRRVRRRDVVAARTGTPRTGTIVLTTAMKTTAPQPAGSAKRAEHTARAQDDEPEERREPEAVDERRVRAEARRRVRPHQRVARRRRRPRPAPTRCPPATTTRPVSAEHAHHQRASDDRQGDARGKRPREPVLQERRPTRSGRGSARGTRAGSRSPRW